MSLTTTSELLARARQGGYAVGAFNCNNMEIAQAIVAAAEEEKAPVILQASQGAIKYAGLKYATALMHLAAREAGVPVAVHLDHGTSFEQAVQCIAAGFTSVMIDGSRFPLKENISLTRRVVEVAGSVGASVEGELGKIGGTEDDITVSDREAAFTDPQEARQFVEETGIDSLAVAIGTAHGIYRGEPRLDFDRLRQIREVVDVPLVLHGSSGVPDQAIRQAIALGICKVNIDTNVRQAFVEGVREVLAARPEEIDPRKILGPAREKMQKVVAEKIRLFGSSSKA